MNLVNATRLMVGYTVATDKTGREWLVLASKGAYDIPARPDHLPSLLEEQTPLVMTDVFSGEPGFSAPSHEIDFAVCKPRCDVILNGSCYAPGGRSVARVTVGLRVGSLAKAFRVIGHRVWKSTTVRTAASSPEPFTVMPISYNNAYGGVSRPTEAPETHQWYLLNHAGVGYHPRTPPSALNGKPLPNTEEIDDPVLRPDGNYRPMAFGPLGRSWQARIKWAGTYDRKWLDDRSPFLPDDFDDRYFQCAPEDQQTDYLGGGEEVTLVNLTPQERTTFRLPTMTARFEVFYKNDDWARLHGDIDTLVLEPDLGRFTLTSRASLPLRRNLHEIRSVVAGAPPAEWYQQQGLRRGPRGKRRFRSLAELAEWNRQRGARS